MKLSIDRLQIYSGGMDRGRRVGAALVWSDTACHGCKGMSDQGGRHEQCCPAEILAKQLWILSRGTLGNIVPRERILPGKSLSVLSRVSAVAGYDSAGVP